MTMGNSSCLVIDPNQDMETSSREREHHEIASLIESTQFFQQMRIDVNDRPSVTDFEPQPIKSFSVSRRVPGFLTAVADFATSPSRVFFPTPSSFCSPSQFCPQLRYNCGSQQLSGIRAELALARWSIASFSTPLLTPQFSLIFPNFSINDEVFSPVVI
jgi:hypothetical protein